MTEQMGNDAGSSRRATRGRGGLAAVLSRAGQGVIRWASRLGRTRGWRWALGGVVLLAFAAAAWSAVVPWASYWRPDPQGLDVGDGWLGWDWVERGEPALPQWEGEDETLTPVDPSLIRVPPVPVPLELPEDPSSGQASDSLLGPSYDLATVASPAGNGAGTPSGAPGADEESPGLEAAASAAASAAAASHTAALPAQGDNLLQRTDLRGNLRLPADGPVVREVGWYRHPTYGDWRYYPGVEIQLRPGTAVRPALAGRVARVEEDARWALTVWVDHGSGWHTSYGYLREARVSPGQTVDEDTVLGISGLSPLGEPQLMFAVWKDGEPVDPARLMP